jgi:hypothetical protein
VEEEVRRLRAAGALLNPSVVVHRVVERFTRREEQPTRQPMALRPTVPLAPPEAQSGIESEHRARSNGDREENHEFQLPAHMNPGSNLNIDSLTTQVMDQIDRRIVAWRERMGRF